MKYAYSWFSVFFSLIDNMIPFLRQVLVLLSELLTAKKNDNVADRCVRLELRLSVTGYTLHMKKLILLSKEPRKKKVETI